MDVTIISKRYAKALFGLALEKKLTDQVYGDMMLIHQVTTENRNLRFVLSSPIIPGGKKMRIIHGLFEQKVSEFTFRFFDLVLKKDRALLIRHIAHNYIDIYKDHNNIVTAVLITAAKIDSKTRNLLMDQLNSISDKTIELEEEVNSDLIGGFVLRLKDAKYDASLRKKIDLLGKNFEKSLHAQKL